MTDNNCLEELDNIIKENNQIIKRYSSGCIPELKIPLEKKLGELKCDG